MNHGRRRIVTMLLVMDALSEHQSLTKHDLVKKLGYGLNTIRMALAELHAGRNVHIVSWISQLSRCGDYTPRFALGDADDAPRPPRITAAQRQRRLRARKRAANNPIFGALIGLQARA